MLDKCKTKKCKRWANTGQTKISVGQTHGRWNMCRTIPVGWKQMINYIPAPPKGERGILFYLCPSKIFFSATIDGRNLIFGHKLHIGMPYCGKRFWTVRFILSWLLYTFNIYAHFSSHFSKQQESDIWSQASYGYAILWEAFLDLSDSYFLE